MCRDDCIGRNQGIQSFPDFYQYNGGIREIRVQSNCQNWV